MSVRKVLRAFGVTNPLPRRRGQCPVGTDLAADAPEKRAWYVERAHLFALITRMYPAVLSYADPREPELPVLYVATPEGQISRHINPDDLGLFARVEWVSPEDPRARWDRSTTAEHHARIRRLLLGTSPRLSR